MKPWGLALIGFGGVVGAVIGDTLLLTVPAIRNGWWTYLLVVPSLALAAAAVVKKRSWGTMVPGNAALLVAIIYTLTRFIPTPSTPPAVAVDQAFPDFTLKDQDGADVSMAGLRKNGPVVVVLFRGKW